MILMNVDQETWEQVDGVALILFQQVAVASVVVAKLAALAAD
jgi:hypothetical protein